MKPESIALIVKPGKYAPVGLIIYCTISPIPPHNMPTIGPNNAPVTTFVRNEIEILSDWVTVIDKNTAITVWTATSNAAVTTDFRFLNSFAESVKLLIKMFIKKYLLCRYSSST